MNKKDFDNLVASIQEAGRIRRGEAEASRVTEHYSGPGWPKGICLGCSWPIKGMFEPAHWEGASEASPERATGALYACRCPSCGVALLAWAPSGGPMDGRQLHWHMHAVRTPTGAKIDETQVCW
jgi:hypothetical protein